jgi:hypothetical protein
MVVFGCPMSEGWTKRKRCGFVARVLIYCFGHINSRISDPDETALALEEALDRQMKARNGKIKTRTPSDQALLSSPYLIWSSNRSDDWGT